MKVDVRHDHRDHFLAIHRAGKEMNRAGEVRGEPVGLDRVIEDFRQDLLE
jgi:hypothetical protein